MAHIHRAKWLIRATGEVLADGAIVAADGRIVRLGPWASIQPHIGPDDTVTHLPDAAILPAFVNAHTHLSLTDFAGKFRPTKRFASWMARLALRIQFQSDDAAARAIERGDQLSREAAVAAGADLTPKGHLDTVLGCRGTAWTVFGEVFLFGDKGLERLAQALETMETLARAAPVRVGLSPHTPFTVGLEVFQAVRRAADERGWPISTHLHETLDEIAFIERGKGGLHTWLRGLGIVPATWRPAGVRPIRMLADAGFFSGPVLVAHGNYLTDDDIAILAASGSSVAYCPRSHAFFKHENHPWQRLLAAGVNVCMGTDSLASCPSLSVLDEARFLFGRTPGIDPRTILDMATRRGAHALGLESDLGDLREGLSATMAAIGPLPPTSDPLAAILGGEGNILSDFGLNNS